MTTMFNSAQQIFDNFDLFYDFILIDKYIKLEVDIISNRGETDPHLCISINDTVLFSDNVSSGIHTLILEYPTENEKDICLKIGMSGKTANDTIVENNEIIQDKFIELTGLKINNFDLFTDYDLFYSKFKYSNNDTQQLTNINSGFWSNSTLMLTATLPFTTWYNNNSTKNINVADSLRNRTNNLTDTTYQKLVKNINLLKK